MVHARLATELVAHEAEPVVRVAAVRQHRRLHHARIGLLAHDQASDECLGPTHEVATRGQQRAGCTGLAHAEWSVVAQLALLEPVTLRAVLDQLAVGVVARAGEAERCGDLLLDQLGVGTTRDLLRAARRAGSSPCVVAPVGARFEVERLARDQAEQPVVAQLERLLLLPLGAEVGVASDARGVVEQLATR